MSGTAPDASPAPRLRGRGATEAALLTAAPLAVLAVWAASGTNYLFDDAFISFRYARHLAEGRGLVWNVGGEPTQGYTNFLLVLLLAGAGRLGLEAPTAALVANALGLALLALGLRSAAGRALGDSRLRILPPAAAALSVLSLQNALSGMETVLWAGLLFLGASLVPTRPGPVRAGPLAGLVAVSGLAVMTRPDSALVAGLWFAGLLAGARREDRRKVLGAGLGLLTLLGAYTAWAEAYFGDFLPNSFYLKMVSPAALPGLRYVAEFLGAERAPLALIALAALLLRPGLAGCSRLWPYACVLVLLPFYALASPLMGHYYRFLYPVHCLIRAAAAAALVQAAQRAAARAPGIARLPRSVLGAGLLAALAWELPSTTLEQFRSPHLWPSLETEARYGRSLAGVPGIEEVRIAFADAGAVPYYSRASSLDVVGLNENRIAREGWRRGPAWVIGYVLDQRPDLVGLYATPEGRVFDAGHGAIGRSYSALALDPRFVSGYRFVGGASLGWMRLNWFASLDSPHLGRLRAAIESASDEKGASPVSP